MWAVVKLNNMSLRYRGKRPHGLSVQAAETIIRMDAQTGFQPMSRCCKRNGKVGKVRKVPKTASPKPIDQLLSKDVMLLYLIWVYRERTSTRAELA
jgi:hypothetical protein